MRSLLAGLLLLLEGLAFGVSKPHVIGFGKPISAKWFVGTDESHPMEMKVRGLYIDGKLKEFTVGAPHDVTDHIFVVRRAFHFNDALPEEGNALPKWRWQRGGWLLLDRISGHVSQVALPGFDTYYSASSWYRDYVAYCGVSDDGKKRYGVVAQLGRRKPLLRKPLGESTEEDAETDLTNKDMPDSACPSPSWQRQPARVTFTTKGQAFTYSIRGLDVEILSVDDDEAGTE